MPKRWSIPFLLLLSASFSARSDAPENYTLQVGKKTYSIALGAEKALVLPDGSTAAVTLELKEILGAEFEYLAFEHRNIYTPGSTDLGDGITQILLVTPTGGVIIIQEYEDFDPTGLVDMMADSLTEEETATGWKRSDRPAQRVIGGKKFQGKRVVTTLRREKWTREVLALSVDGRGLLIMTALDHDEEYATDKAMLDLFWKSLEVKI